MPLTVLLSFALLGGAWVVSGAAVLRSRRATAAGAALTVTGLGLVAVAVLDATVSRRASDLAFEGTWLVGTLTLLAFPRVRWQNPVDALALVAVALSPLALAIGSAETPASYQTSSGAWYAGILLTAATLSIWSRLERADADERWSLTWLALSFGLALFVGALVSFAAPTPAGAVVAAAFFALIGPGLVLGVTRSEVLNVRTLVVQVVVLLTALISYVAIFMIGVNLLDVLGVKDPRPAALALLGGGAALAFQPIRTMLRSAVDEIIFGARPDPIDAARQVADRIGDDPVLALRSIREALAIPHAQLRVDGAVAASSGQPSARTHVVPLQGTSNAELVIGLREGDVALSAADEHLLRLVAPLLAQGLRARALAADLQESRELTITAREEERRRLRRDLHDGLGPRLSGIAFTADAAANVLGDQEAAAELIATMRREAAEAIAAIRELVYGMRPPAIDELGLVPALRQAVGTLRAGSGRPLAVTIEAPALPDLPAAVEVAAYRIALEALTNVARHTSCERATLRLERYDGQLVVQVDDHGTTGSPWRPGVGISSMRERAEELGGHLEASGSETGGTVRAVLPA